MSELTKKRVHWTEYNGDELLHDEDVDVLTSADAVTFDDGEDLQHKYTQGQFVSPSTTGILSNLSTENKSSLVDAVNEVKSSATSNESSITSLTNRVSTNENDIDSLETRMDTAESDIDSLEKRVTPISLGGTGATTASKALTNLGITTSVSELNALVGKSLAGKTVSPTEDTTVTAGEGAEIFNDYYTRTSTSAYGNIASGKFSHAEGCRTTASGNYSHSEGHKTTASDSYAHAEGSVTSASNHSAHAEGTGTTANGMNSHAEGFYTTASGYTSHAEGYETTASGDRSHAEGCETSASGDYSHAEGHSTTASGDYSHAEGSGTLAEKNYAHAEGLNTKAQGGSSHAEGTETIASAGHSHAEGYKTTASGAWSHSEGYDNTASGDASHVEGNGNVASGNYSHAEGQGTDATGSYSHAEGHGTLAAGMHSHAGGWGTIANRCQTALGRYNKSSDGMTSQTDTSGDIFIIGNGGFDTQRSNAFRVTTAGKAYGLANFSGSGAGVAELYEWQDGNPDNEDRRGLFVTLDGEKIKIASPDDDYILGTIDPCPYVVGDVQSEIWKDMYLKDVFGERMIETVEVEETTDENGEVIPAHTEERWILNPEYDPTQTYVSRDERSEYVAITSKGKVVMIDDGTCRVNGYCTVGKNGVATASETNYAVRVMERIDDTHIKVYIDSVFINQ